MNEYSYTEIQEVDKLGVHFKDGKEINFEECRLNWIEDKKLNYEDSFCVAERNIDVKVPYFMFYDQDRTKVIFKKSRLPFRDKSQKQFLKMRTIHFGMNGKIADFAVTNNHFTIYFLAL